MKRTILKAVEAIKMLQIREDAHKRIKELSAIRGMTMKDYTEYLIELDEEQLRKERVKE